MKWLDSLFSGGKPHTSLSKGEDIRHNTSTKSYRDIRKRHPVLSLSQNIYGSERTPFSLRENIEKLYLTLARFFSGLGGLHWCLLGVILIAAYCLYSVGFIIRTEQHILVLRDHPETLLTHGGLARLHEMRQDFQILAPLIQNPIFPIEPLATYGRALESGYALVKSIDVLKKQEKEVMYWKSVATTTSIFPLIDGVFDWIESIDSDVRGLIEIVQTQGEFDTTLLGDFWSNLQHYRETWYTLLGKDGPTRILLLNQNSDELRAGGGFPGTAFIIEFDGGKMTRFQFYDIYALDWHLRGYRPSPEGINRFRSLDYPGKPVEFEIRDANYYPRFHESAVKLDELAQEAGIGKLDLVVGINQVFLEDIVRLVEPIKIEGIPITIDHKNVTLILSMLVEGKKTLADTPKGTVKILADTLLDALIAKNKQQHALMSIASHIYQGEFVVGSSRPEIQKALDALGIFDRWQAKKGDWVYPLFTSISRNKSDRLMERTFEINQTGRCERTLILRQKHWFDLIEAARIRTLAHELGLENNINTLLPIQGGGDNVQYLRFILPPGTTLLPKSDPDFTLLETTSLFTTIHGYETTSPGTTKTMSIRYLLPEGHCSDSTEFFKQPGLRNTRVVIQKEGRSIFQKFYE